MAYFSAIINQLTSTGYPKLSTRNRASNSGLKSLSKEEWWGVWFEQVAWNCYLCRFWAIDSFVYMTMSSNMQSGYNSQNPTPVPVFSPAFLSLLVLSLGSQFQWKRTNRASKAKQREWCRFKCSEEIGCWSRVATSSLKRARSYLLPWIWEIEVLQIFSPFKRKI